MTHRLVQKLSMTALLALVAAAALVPAAQADVQYIGKADPQMGQVSNIDSVEARAHDMGLDRAAPKPVQMGNIDSIEARWHNVGYDLRRPNSGLPLDFTRHKGSVSTVTHTADGAAPVATQTSSSSFNWTAAAVVSALVAALGLAGLVGGTMVRRRPVTS
jgi:MYXO-CTERM domain-containing protein